MKTSHFCYAVTKPAADFNGHDLYAIYRVDTNGADMVRLLVADGLTQGQAVALERELSRALRHN